METLELKPPTRKLTIVLIEKEYDEPIRELESNNLERNEILHTSSLSFRKFVRQLALNSKPDFATEELGDRSKEEFYKSPLAHVFQELNVPFFPVDVSDYARPYLLREIDELNDQLTSTLKRVEEMRGEKARREDIEYLTEYAKYLEHEVRDRRNQINYEVRINWIAKGIIDSSEKVAKDRAESGLLGVHICSPRYMDLLEKKLDSLGVYVKPLSLKYSYSIERERPFSIPSMKIKVKPTLKIPKRLPYLLFFLSTDDIVSPFDICMAYDAGFDIVNTYDNISTDIAKRIVQDAMFSRGPSGIKHTCFFIGGKDIERVEEVASTVRDVMFNPFKTSVIVDPKGAYTTSAAMVAKAEDTLHTEGFGKLSDKTCAVFGTGPVGRITSVLLSKLGCKVSIISLVSGLAYVTGVADELNRKYSVYVKGLFAPTKVERLRVMLDSDVVFTAVAPGTRVVDKSILDKLNMPKLFVDVNAVPPFTIENLRPKDDLKEIRHGIYGVGALVVGDLKYKVEMEMLRRARLSGGGFYDYNYAFDVARRMLKEKEMMPEISMVLGKKNADHQ